MRESTFFLIFRMFTPAAPVFIRLYLFRLSATPGKTLEAWKRLKQSASLTIAAAGGTISHQHGVGTDHKKYMAAEKGTIGIQALEKMFNHLDPKHQMNPGKLLPDWQKSEDR